ncbi:phosphate acetyltransferase [Marinobacter daepoensis]|uniref:Phosphate acetyltransferase n=1 Tax=Marinobacter daepoensis TaxID=262077 RepID=A0ABS3BCZ2_9GAMM|nr:phosphate acetyltransferase [Marinobacter daepoensis]MBN7769240.1 phosphate acetyltransferase [Marinobacter daepoensis]MBY6077930.1 phosphate acetyltransferase [Marinobacter daepoensis]
MAKSLFLAPTSLDSGLTSVCLGLLRALEREGVSVGFYKPFSQSVHRGEALHNDGKDSSVAFVRARSHLQPPDPIPLKKAQQLLNHGKADLLMENIVGEYQKVANEVDVVIIEGLVPDRTEAYIARLNVEVARNLGSEVILVSTPKSCTPGELDEELDFSARLFAAPSDPDVIAVILNKVGEPQKSGLALNLPPASDATDIDYQSSCRVFSTGRFQLLAQIPWQPQLLAPRVSDVARELGVPVLHEGQMETRRVQRVSVCARTIRNMTDTLKPGTLMVTPGDREDIVVATAVAALNGVPLAGLMLTGGLMPDDRVIELCRRALDTGLPVLSSETNTYESAHMLANLSAAIPIDDPERIEEAMESVARRINTQWLQEHLKVQRQSRLAPPAFRYQLSERARAAAKRIVLPEGCEPRTIQAAIICHQRRLAHCVLIGDPHEIRSVATSQGVELPDDLEIIHPPSVRDRFIAPMVELRKHKGLTPEMAEAMLEDNVVLGTMMVAMDEADGLVSGAIHTTANTVRPALQLIKTHDNAKVVSSVFFMLLPQQVLVYGDCAINPDPNAEELADIAIQSAESAEAFGIEPVVAMISYSTGESGSGEDVDKVREATRIARERRPDLLIDGPLQYDAAAIESVAKSKAPNSRVAGKATVFVFPDLNTGNTTYKAVQRSANVVSVGPMLQGLRKPVNDLSRGALVEDIVFTIALTAVQAKQVEEAGAG